MIPIPEEDSVHLADGGADAGHRSFGLHGFAQTLVAVWPASG